MHMVKRYHVPMDRITEQKTENKHDHWADRPEGKQSTTPAIVALSPTMRILIIALIAVSMSLYAGLEMAYFSHSPTYFQYLAISLSAKQSADLLTVATTCYTLGRISAAYMASKLRPEVMLAIHYVIIGLSLGVLYFGQTSLTAIWIGNAFFGLGLSALWSAYLSLGEKFITLNNKITAVFSIAAGILWLAAPFLIGPLIEQHPNVLMILELVYFVLSIVVFTMLCVIFTILIPFCPNIWLLYLCSFIVVMGIGAYDSSTSVWIIELWADKSALWLQISGFMFGVGCIVSPMIIKPYLTGDLSRGVGSAAADPLVSINSTFVDNINDSVDRRALIQVPYMLVGAICAIGPVLFLIMHLVKQYHVPMDRVTQQPIENKHDHLADKPEGELTTSSSMVALSPTMRVIIIALIAVSMCLYCGMEQVYFGYSATYYQYLAISLSAKQSADLMIALTTVYTLGRLLAAYMASKLSPEAILAIHYAIIGLSLGILYFGQTSIIAIWIGNALIGLGLSALWSAYLSLGEKFITLNNRITAIFSIAAGLLGLVSPFVIGPLIEQHPNIVMILTFVYFVLSIVVFTMLWCTSKQSQKSK
ncbi:unnamed protein product [Medioppia subpectinata]|uniref:Major facilitator superfamily domain-containing protein 4A n=1 Tax=Medioppia subpectinata TaxID=1979941 RepID=A0A7R9KGL6_9ACAR|nr:unnamed protein product [Medioppia subpectinata]CAG2102988.1 unnamed protein product [Medioppia subpectinata]